jgi:hypothetical protein
MCESRCETELKGTTGVASNCVDFEMGRALQNRKGYSTEELTASVTLMMKAINSSETAVNIYQTTRCYIIQDSHLHTRRRGNLKSHQENSD